MPKRSPATWSSLRLKAVQLPAKAGVDQIADTSSASASTKPGLDRTIDDFLPPVITPISLL